MFTFKVSTIFPFVTLFLNHMHTLCILQIVTDEAPPEKKPTKLAIGNIVKL